MHILVIPSWYPSPENPIRGIFFLEQAQALQKAGHQVRVLVPPTLKSIKKLREIRSISELMPKFQVETYKGIKTHRLSAWKWIPLPDLLSKKLWLRWYGNKAFKAYLKEEGKPDIIHAHSLLYGGYLAVQLKKKQHIPVVLTEHSTGFRRNIFSKKQINLIKKYFPKVDETIAVSASLEKDIQSYLPQKNINILGNIVDSNYFYLSTSPPCCPFVFCLIAFLTPKKGVDIALQSFAKAFKGRGVLLKIAGSGAEKNNLMNLAKRLGIAQQVDFMGLLSQEQVRDLLHQSHALVSSSYIETFGVNLIEAMSCGRPVISTRSGGPEMFVNEHNGILVPPGDIDALAKAMERMLENYSQYEPAKIRSECVAKFGEAAIIHQLEVIYQNVIKRNF